jgi:hypothetical protein
MHGDWHGGQAAANQKLTVPLPAGFVRRENYEIMRFAEHEAVPMQHLGHQQPNNAVGTLG